MSGRCCVEPCDDPRCLVCSATGRIPDQSMLWIDRLGYPASGERKGKPNTLDTPAAPERRAKPSRALLDEEC